MTPFHILIVDDDELLLKVMHEWFENLSGCPTVTVQNADEALDILSRVPFDVVITDISQQGMDGIELTREIRRRGGPPVIIYSGYGSEEDYEAAMQAGAAAFVQKPEAFEALYLIVEQVVKMAGLNRTVD